MQKKEILIHEVDYVEGVPNDFFILHGTDGTTRVTFHLHPKLLLELARLYQDTGHAGHAIWHRHNPEHPIPCSQCTWPAVE